MKYELPSACDSEIWDIWLSSYRLPAVTAAAECGLFETIGDGSATSEELSRELGLEPVATKAVLRMLAALGLLVPRAGRMQLTGAAATFLRTGSNFSMLPALRLGLHRILHDQLTAALGEKRSSEDLKRKNLPASNWADGQIDDERARSVAAVMHAHSLSAAAALARSGRMEDVRRLLDVGGGSGCYAIALAQRHPALRAVIMDLPAMCDCAAGYVSEAGVDGQVSMAAVDMFRHEWPTGFDGILLSNILHDWNEDTVAELLMRAHRSLAPGGRIFVHEMLLDDDEAGPPAAAAFSLMMLLTTWGQQFTFRELRSLLRDAGFSAIRADPGHGYFSLVSATRE